MKAKVRGICSTALMKLLLENGFEIVQPSLAIRKRFRLEENSMPPDLNIKDGNNLQGIRILGISEAVDAFGAILHSTFKEARAVLTLNPKLFRNAYEKLLWMNGSYML